MIDVAQAAGVSQGTVSVVLNGIQGARIAKATRDRVLEAARELGYAKGLGQANIAGQLQTIGVLVDELEPASNLMGILHGLQQEALASHFLIAVYLVQGSPLRVTAALEALRKQSALGVIYVSAKQKQIECPSGLSEMRCVFLNCGCDDRQALSVLAADRAAAYAATERLLAMGHRRIAHLADASAGIAARERHDGYRQALLNADLPIDRGLVLTGGTELQSGQTLARQALGLAKPATAFLCDTAALGLEASRAIAALGLRMPDDISVVVCEDDPQVIAAHDTPLSAYAPPFDEMGREAVRVLLEYENIRRTQQYPRAMRIECDFVERGSIVSPALQLMRREA